MSKIEVDAVTQQSGSTLTVGGGASKTVVADATTVTLGRCGGTVALASGATQSGFGRTGTVDWQTGSIKTSTFTAANGEGYFANTSGGAFTMNLPAGTAGNIVSVADYTNTFQTNNLTITPNGSQKIGGVAANAVLSTEGQSVTFVYVDDIEGWKNVQDSTSNTTGDDSLIATGGTITISGDCKIHTFTGPGTFTVSQASGTAAENVVSYMVVAGGGGGGASDAGGGGAGGFRELKSPTTPYTASPLDGYPSAPNRITVTAQAYPIVVGAGGTNVTGPTMPAQKGGNGSVSSFSTISSAGGGGGASAVSPQSGNKGQDGGSGGGGGRDGVSGNGGGSGNTPPVSPSQGNNGGTSPTSGWTGGGGGGGATAAGTGGSGGSPGSEVAGNGGAGATTSINGTPTARAGGGGGSAAGNSPSSAGVGGAGGGGNGGTDSGPGARAATAGTVNTGGGGGGDHGPPSFASGAGGSGIVIIRYKFQ
jgi:hypothetical protein